MTNIRCLKMDSEMKRAKQDKKNGLKITQQIHSIQHKRDSIYKAHALIVDKKAGYPYKLYLGERDGKRIEAQGDSVVINGFPSIVTPFGFISMPLVFSSIEDRMKRNPFDPYAICSYLKEQAGTEPLDRYGIPAQQKRIDYFSGLSDVYHELLLQIDSVSDKNAYNYVYYQYAKVEEWNMKKGNNSVNLSF